MPKWALQRHAMNYPSTFDDWCLRPPSLEMMVLSAPSDRPVRSGVAVRRRFESVEMAYVEWYSSPASVQHRLSISSSQSTSSGQSIMSTSTSSVERVQGGTDVHVLPRFNGTTVSKVYYVCKRRTTGKWFANLAFSWSNRKRWNINIWSKEGRRERYERADFSRKDESTLFIEWRNWW